MGPNSLTSQEPNNSFKESYGYSETRRAERSAEVTRSLLALVEQTESSDSSPARDNRLATSSDLAETLRIWSAERVSIGERLTRDTLARLLGQDIASIDKLISGQLDAILHHHSFQQLESTWRGLCWLLGQAEEANSDAGRKPGEKRPVRVRILSVTKKELRRDQENAVEFDRSNLWRKVYEEEFGTAGGMPYGLLVTDHEFGHQPEDVSLLAGMSETAMAAFSPLLASPSPRLVGADTYRSLEKLPPITEAQQSAEFLKWRSLREREESRFIGLPLPRVLARQGYDGWLSRPEAIAAPEKTWGHRAFRYAEETDLATGNGRLWMSGVWPLAGVVLREFGRSGWFADIRGGSRGLHQSGEVLGLPFDTFPGAEHGAAVRGPTESSISSSVQEEIDDVGMIPLCQRGPEGLAVFHSNMTLHRPKRFDSVRATTNERLSSMLQYVLCVSRFAQYLKVILRDKAGSFTDSQKLQDLLNKWVHQYVTPDDRASADVRAQMPLRAAEIEVQDDPGTAGGFRVVMRLQPHFQIDRIDSTLRLVSTIRPSSGPKSKHA